MSFDAALAERREVARRIDAALVPFSEVVSVFAVGSLASGLVDEHSDVDVAVLCEPEVPTAPRRRSALEVVSGGWTSTDRAVGDSLWRKVDTGVVDGIGVTVHYQTAAVAAAILRQVLEEAAITTDEVPFRPYTLAALVTSAWVLTDRRGLLARWRQDAATFPKQLQDNIIHHFQPILEEHTSDLVINASRRLGPQVFLFHLTQAVDAMVSILLAVNQVFDPADKRMEKTVLPCLKRVPVAFMDRFAEVLEGPKVRRIGRGNPATVSADHGHGVGAAQRRWQLRGGSLDLAPVAAMCNTRCQGDPRPALEGRRH